MHTSRRARACRAIHHGLLGVAMLALLFGCGGTREKVETPEALRLHTNLIRFAQYYTAAISATADEIAEKTDDRLVRELTLRWKLTSIPVMQGVVGHEDPRHALVDAWLLCVRQRLNFESGAMKDVFGDLQPIAVAKVKELQERIQGIGRAAMPTGEFDEAEKELEAYVRGQPTSAKFDAGLMQASNRITEESHPSLFSILSIPIGGLSETAKSIARVASVGEVFTQVVQEMPERVRWETQLFLLEASRTGMLGEAIGDFSRLSKAIESVSETAKGLPAQLRAEVEGLLSATGATLQQARELVADLRAMLPELQGPLDSTKAISAELTSAGSAWTTAGTAVDAAMTTISNMGSDDTPAGEPPPPPSEDSFKVSDLTDAGTALHGAAVEIRGLLDDLESEKTDAAVATSLDDATQRLEELADTLTLRAIYVLAVLLVGWFLIRRYGTRRA